MEKVTLTVLGIKLAIQHANDYGINEVFIYEDGDTYVTNPAPSVSLTGDRHPVYKTFPGVYVRLELLYRLSHTMKSGRNTKVTLTQDGSRVLVRYP